MGEAGAAALVRLALRALRRDLRGAQFVLIAVAVALAVAALTAVDLVAARVRGALAQQSSQLMAADLALIGNDPLPAGYTHRARNVGLAANDVAKLRSMVSFDEQLELVEIKAAGAGYPLRGELRVAASRDAAPRTARAGPAPGTVWVDTRFLDRFGSGAGDTVIVGELPLRIAGVITNEPDRGGEMFSMAPRLLMNLADLPATGLVLPGSRMRYELLLAGSGEALAAFRTGLELAPGVKLLTPAEARPELRTALDRAGQFLALAALVALVLAGVAILLAADGFAREHVDMVALLRTLGASRGRILALFAIELGALGVLAAGAGCAVGYGVHFALVAILGDWLGATPAPVGFAPLARGLVAGIVALAGFGLPPLWRLRAVPAAAILRRDPGMQGGRLGGLVLGLAVLVVLAPWRSGAWQTTAWALAGFALCLAGLALASFVLLVALAGLRPRAGVYLAAGLATLLRHRARSALQITGLGLGIAALLILGLVRSDLLAQWRASLPANAPDQFLINIQPAEGAAITGFLRGHGVAEPELYPMIRGRLVAIDDRPVDPARYADARTRGLAEREFNLSVATELKPDNRIDAGAWWSAGADPAQFSIETDIARDLGIRLGDTLTYRIAEKTVTARVTSLRHVSWDSMQVNFFVVAPPGLLEPYPATLITSFKLPPADRTLLRDLVKRFPSVTVIDVAAVIGQLRTMMDRAARAIELVFGFTVLAGVVVLLAAVQATQGERIYTAVIWKTFGAERRQLLRAVSVEFVLLSGLAALVASLTAYGAGWAFATRVLKIAYAPDLAILPAGIALAILGVAAAGVYAIRLAWAAPVQSVLRRTG
ncbi:MAG: ABC transporter permease [Gammaproteobacteria bacterium]|nr:ABC transporter permease [Gammaproteobacteria bacterium]